MRSTTPKDVLENVATTVYYSKQQLKQQKQHEQSSLGLMRMAMFYVLRLEIPSSEQPKNVGHQNSAQVSLWYKA